MGPKGPEGRPGSFRTATIMIETLEGEEGLHHPDHQYRRGEDRAMTESCVEGTSPRWLICGARWVLELPKGEAALPPEVVSNERAGRDLRQASVHHEGPR